MSWEETSCDRRSGGELWNIGLRNELDDLRANPSFRAIDKLGSWVRFQLPHARV
ncbi:MAG: hypothetical protein SWY16_06630 [Cyanobacteriota bacterium]|nr:hypothetical protein [Cyanobacteriota bacterium]